MQGENLQEKQTFLRKQIIDGGFDAQAFMQYMGSIKNQGENIDLQVWTMTQLKDVISNFKDQMTKNIEEMINSRLFREIKKTKIFESKKQQVKYEGTNLWDFQINEEQQCTTSEIQFKFKPNSTPLIKIDKFEIKSVGGFIFGIGSRNQLQLNISTNFTESKIIRKGQDCSWLKAILTLKHPGCFVPPLQDQRQLSTDDTKGIKSRVNEIQKFLNSLLKYNSFTTCYYFKEFLQQNNYKKFGQFKTRELSFATQKDIDVIKTPSGKFNIEISEKINKTIKQTSQIAYEINNLYNDYNNCFSRIINDMDNLTRNVKQLGDLTNKLSEKYLKAKDTLKITDFKLDTLTMSLNNTIEIVNKNLKRQLKALAEFNEGFMKVSSRDWKEMLQYDRRQQNEVKFYLNKKEELIRKKEKNMGDPTKWELPEVDFIAINKKGIAKMSKGQIFDKMFPSENQGENMLRIWLSFVNQSYLDSFKVFLLEQQKDFISNYLRYSSNHMCAINEVQSSFKAFNQIITS